MNIDSDKISHLLKQSTDILFVKNPVSTSMGVLFGYILHGVFNFISPFIQTYELVRSSALSVFHFIAFGVFGFNIKNLINRHKVSPSIESAFSLIDEQLAKGNISKSEAKLQYHALVSKAVDDARANSNSLPRKESFEVQD